MKKMSEKLNRIAVLIGIFLILGLSCLSEATEKKIVWNSSGGIVEKVAQKVFAEPFEKETGIKVIFTAPVNFAKLKAMSESGNIEWDITELRPEDMVRGMQRKYLDPIDYAIVDQSDFLPGLSHSHGVPAAFYSCVIGYNTSKFPTGNHPKSWKDFWDVKRFPGPRSLPNYPWTMEIALLADGVPPEKLYPLDEKRAWASLDKIKSHVSKWWTMPAEPAQLLTDKEVYLVAAYNGRIAGIQKEGVPVAIEWNQQIFLLAYNSVVKGAKNKDGAMKFLAFMYRPELQAAWVQTIPYPGPSKSMFKYISPELAKALPTYPEYYKTSVHRNPEYWAQHEERLMKEWYAWMLK